MNKKMCFLTLPLLLTVVSACNNSGDNTPTNPEDIVIDEHYYEDITKRVSFDETNDENFIDDITNGLDDNIWNTLDGYWEAGGTIPHNGVRRRNLFYTKDSSGNGYLAMKARGIYNRTDPEILGKPEGACIETKRNLGPGRYEVYMAAMPRDGGCSAFWTYCNPERNESITQYEIDIEIGGSGQFTNLWCTTWTAHENKATQAPDVSNICYMNDGKIHKYTFDWYTNFLGSGEGRIDWFIDEQHVQTISGGTVPATESPAWLGIWLPSWAGSSAFEEDYLLVDKVTYKAFDFSQFYDETRSYTTYSPKDPSQSNIQSVDFESITTKLNKLANADFETAELFAENNHYGWLKHPRYSGTVELTEDRTTGDHAFLLKEGEGTTRTGAYYYQNINCAYKGFSYDFSIDAKKGDADSSAKVWIVATDKNGVKNVLEETIQITSTEYSNYKTSVTLPEKSGILSVYLIVESGSAYFDNAQLFKK